MSAAAGVGERTPGVPGVPGRKAWNIESGLLLSIEILAAVILLAEIGILFVGVVARYALGVPVTGPTSSRRFCSSGSRCWERRSRSSATSICG